MESKILVVEDKPQINEDLARQIEKNIKEVVVHQAFTINEANDKIDRMIRNKERYFAAILDFKLPKDTGYEPDFDFSICKELRHRMKQTIIIHITAFPEDPKILSHINEKHTSPRESVGKMLPKKKQGWRSSLINELKAHFYGLPIQRKLRRLFPEKNLDNKQDRLYYRISGGLSSCMTYQISELIGEITENWKHLDSYFKAEIRCYFQVDETNDRIRVSLL